MCAIVFTCPTLRCEVDSGIDLDEATYDRARLTVTQAHCPACDRHHRFLLADTRLAEGFSRPGQPK